MLVDNPEAERIFLIVSISLFLFIIGIIIVLISLIVAVLNTSAETERIRKLLEERLPEPSPNTVPSEIEQK